MMNGIVTPAVDGAKAHPLVDQMPITRQLAHHTPCEAPSFRGYARTRGAYHAGRAAMLPFLRGIARCRTMALGDHRCHMD